ncbi:MAG: response regulator transcription factor [Peptostreptococcales bacterium]
MAKRILIVEDEEKLRRVIKDYCISNGWEVLEAKDGLEGLEQFQHHPVDLIILDIMLPHMTGYELCKKIRETSDTLIIMVTAKTEEEDYLRGYSTGANDYVSKPFNVKVLMAKIKSLFEMRDNDEQKNNHENYIHKDFKINFEERNIFYKGERIEITSKEYDFLTFMIKNKNIALSRQTILDNVWGVDYQGTDRAIDNLVKRLRMKMDKDSLPIKSIRGYGYTFEVKI